MEWSPNTMGHAYQKVADIPIYKLVSAGHRTRSLKYFVIRPPPPAWRRRRQSLSARRTPTRRRRDYSVLIARRWWRGEGRFALGRLPVGRRRRRCRHRHQCLAVAGGSRGSHSLGRLAIAFFRWPFPRTAVSRSFASDSLTL